MTESKYFVEVETPNGVQTEEHYLNDAHPQEQAAEMIKVFNAEEIRRNEVTKGKYTISKRTLISVNSMNVDTKRCQYIKTSLFSIIDKVGPYDMCQCQQCGLTAKRYGFGLSSHYTAHECHPELVCKSCNKEFKNLANLERHNKLRHSK